MIDHIYIPTLGRSNNQITFDNMSGPAQSITTLVVQPKEEHLYENYPILFCQMMILVSRRQDDGYT